MKKVIGSIDSDCCGHLKLSVPTTALATSRDVGNTASLGVARVLAHNVGDILDAVRSLAVANCNTIVHISSRTVEAWECETTHGRVCES
jgi:hypothetical protein